jgi:L-amino acid N-acyltransferase YncA
MRRATPDDITVLLSLRKPFWQDQISKGLLDKPKLDQDSLLESTLAILKRPRTSVYLAFREEQAWGYAYGQARAIPGASAIVGMVEELYVDPSIESPTTALGLLRQVIADLKDYGSLRVQAKILAKNEMSRKFFEICGFRLNLLYYELGDGLF